MCAAPDFFELEGFLGDALPHEREHEAIPTFNQRHFKRLGATLASW